MTYNPNLFPAPQPEKKSFGGKLIKWGLIGLAVLILLNIFGDVTFDQKYRPGRAEYAVCASAFSIKVVTVSNGGHAVAECGGDAFVDDSITTITTVTQNILATFLETGDNSQSGGVWDSIKNTLGFGQEPTVNPDLDRAADMIETLGADFFGPDDGSSPEATPTPAR